MQITMHALNSLMYTLTLIDIIN